MKILLDYVFPISVITPTPEASTAHLKQACLVCKPKSGQEGLIGDIILCTSMTAVAAITDNVDAQQLFNAGMTKVYILISDELDLDDTFVNGTDDFYTLIVSSDYTDADIIATQASGTCTISSYANLVDTAPDSVKVGDVTFVAQSGAVDEGDATFRAASSNDATATSLAAQINAHEDLDGVVTAVAVGAIVTITAVQAGVQGNTIDLTYTDGSPSTVGANVSGSGNLAGGDGLSVGTFSGVIGIQTQDTAFAATQAAIANRCAFYASSGNKAKNMCFAFGSLLSNLSNWLNQQYISMPLNDDIDELGEANSLFDDKVSFVINDSEFSNRLALFCAGGKAIVAPYIIENLRIDLQSRTLQYLSANQPQYTIREATLLENRLQEDVINEFISLNWIEAGTVSISLVEDNFVANGAIDVSEPKALWRVFGELRQTL